MIKVSQFLSISGQGKRARNEDFILPVQTNVQKEYGCYVICDGVGGSSRGDLAAKAVAETFFECMQVTGPADRDDSAIRAAIRSAELVLGDLVLENPEFNGLATTLVAAVTNEESLRIVTVGDSRAFLIRQGQIVYRNHPHNLAWEALMPGTLPTATTLKDPRNRVLTNSVSSIEGQAKPTIEVLDACKNGDILLICSDGVTDVLPETEFTNFYTGQEGMTIMQEMLQKECEEKAKDNYSAIFLRLSE